MVKAEKFGHFHLVYNFKVPLHPKQQKHSADKPFTQLVITFPKNFLDFQYQTLIEIQSVLKENSPYKRVFPDFLQKIHIFPEFP